MSGAEGIESAASNESRKRARRGIIAGMEADALKIMFIADVQCTQLGRRRTLVWRYLPPSTNAPSDRKTYQRGIIRIGKYFRWR